MSGIWSMQLAEAAVHRLLLFAPGVADWWIMPPSNAEYSETFRVRTFEAGPSGTLKYVCLLNYLQNAAADHAEVLGVSVDWMQRERLAWVLARYHVKVHKFPASGSRIVLTTWPSGSQRLFVTREFEVRDEEGDLVSTATSGWLLLDSDSLRPLRPFSRLPDFPRDPRRAIDNKFAPLSEPAQVDREVEFRVRMHDLDMNGHVNNVIYVEWGLESAPEELWKDFHPVETESHFTGMAFYGDRVTATTAVEERGETVRCVHSIKSSENGRELTRVHSRWEPNQHTGQPQEQTA